MCRGSRSSLHRFPVIPDTRCAICARWVSSSRVDRDTLKRSLSLGRFHMSPSEDGFLDGFFGSQQNVNFVRQSWRGNRVYCPFLIKNSLLEREV